MIGVADERLGEAPKAFVVKKPGHQVDLYFQPILAIRWISTKSLPFSSNN